MDFAVFIKAPKSFQAQYCQLVNKMQQPVDQEPRVLTFYPSNPTSAADDHEWAHGRLIHSPVIFMDECAYMSPESFTRILTPIIETKLQDERGLVPPTHEIKQMKL